MQRETIAPCPPTLWLFRLSPRSPDSGNPGGLPALLATVAAEEACGRQQQAEAAVWAWLELARGWREVCPTSVSWTRPIVHVGGGWQGGKSICCQTHGRSEVINVFGLGKHFHVHVSCTRFTGSHGPRGIDHKV